MKPASGQTFTEAVIVLPLFLVLAFALLQIGHLGIAMAVVSYGASSAARQAVEKNDLTDTSATDRLKKLLSVGLQSPSAHCQLDGDAITPNVTVTACASLPVYPFIGSFLYKTLSDQVSGNSCAAGAKSFGPVAVKGPPYIFIVQGQAAARMNYPAIK